MDVIRCDEQQYLVWKWRPSGEANSTKKENSIRYGSSLRVKDGEVTVFVYKQDDGTMMDFVFHRDSHKCHLHVVQIQHPCVYNNQWSYTVRFCNDIQFNIQDKNVNTYFYKKFEMALYPDSNHSIYYGRNTRYHLFEKIAEFFKANLK